MIVTEAGRWRIQHDPDATRRAYAAIAAKQPPRCDCEPCQNFWALGARAFPNSVFQLFQVLAIDPEYPAELFHDARLPTGRHSYGGWYHFVGDLLEGREGWREVDPKHWVADFEDMGEHFSLGLSRKADLVPDAFAPSSVIQVDFAAELPWVLEAPEPG